MLSVFFSALILAFSGAMMPGPLLTYTVDESLVTGPKTGLLVITGHAFLEIALIALIFMGFDSLLQSLAVQIAIGLVGGILLVGMGLDMIYKALHKKVKLNASGKKRSSSKNILLSGFLISAANPYFLLWWAVIGLGFLLQAYQSYGLDGIVVFYAGHVSADYIWFGFISLAVGKTRKFIRDDLYRIILVILGIALIYFGGDFVYKAIISWI
jgi:threonine/homoserine/homoserine lactone efflux protein